METNRIIDELRALASLNWDPEQKEYYKQQAKDARPVQCVRMRDVLTQKQLDFLKRWGYKTQQKMCYRNAAELVRLIAGNGAFDLTREPVRYVEGYAYACELLPIEHAFVKIGDVYIDPTFERALHRDVRKELYVSCVELDQFTMATYLLETGTYGGLYYYNYLRKYRPKLAERVAAMNPHNRQ